MNRYAEERLKLYNLHLEELVEQKVAYLTGSS
jgi:hypothetical protein